MQKRAQIALSALISLSAAVVPACAADGNKRSVAQLVVPPAVPAMPSSAVSVPVSSARLRQAARNSYPADHLHRGLYLKQKGDADAALIEFLKAAQENPDNVRAFYEQALIFKNQGLTKLAQSSLQQALSIKPDYKDARVLLASLYLEAGDLNSASQELIKTLGLAKAAENKPAEPQIVINSTRVRHVAQALPAPNPIEKASGSMHLQMASSAVPATTPVPAVPPPAVSRVPAMIQPMAVAAAAILPPPVQPPIQSVLNTPHSAAVPQAKKPDPFGDAINDLLKGIPGLDPGANNNSASGPPSVVSGAGDNPVPKELANTTKTVTLKGNAANALVHAGTASQQSTTAEENGGIRFPNLFGFFHHAEDPAEKARAIVEELKAKRQREMVAEQQRLAKESKSEKQVAIQTASSKRQTEAPSTAAKQTKRERKSWLSAWLDNMLDASAEHGHPASPQPVQPVTHTKPAMDEVSPIESIARTIARQADQLMPKKPLQPIAVQNNYSDRPNISMAMPPAAIEPSRIENEERKPQPAVQAVPAVQPQPVPQPQPAAPQTESAPQPQPAPQVQPAPQPQPVVESWLPPQFALPKPIDLSALIKKAVAWLPPMPVFKPLRLLDLLQPSLPPVQKIEFNAAAPPPVPGLNSAVYSSMMSAARVAAANQRNVSAVPPPLPQHIHNTTTQAAPTIAFLANLPFFHKFVERLLPQLQPTRVRIASGRQLAPIAPAAVRTITGVTSRPEPHAIPADVSAAPAVVELPEVPQLNHVPVPLVPDQPEPEPFVRAVASSGREAPVVQPQLPPSDLPPLSTQNSNGLKLTAISPQLAPRAEQIAVRLSAKGFKFVGPRLTAKQAAFVSGLQSSMKAMKPVMAPVAPAPPEDAWVTRMKYLLAHGTANMRPGEAFMFSEATGEGVIFLRDGSSIRRKLAEQRSQDEVIRQRRPDLLKPQVELQYNLSLLGKIIKPEDKKSAQSVKQKAPNTVPAARSAAVSKQLQDSTVSDAKPSDFLDNSNFFGWLKGVFKL